MKDDLERKAMRSAIDQVEDNADALMYGVDEMTRLIRDIFPDCQPYGHLTGNLLCRIIGHIAAEAGHSEMSEELVKKSFYSLFEKLHSCAQATFNVNRELHDESDCTCNNEDKPFDDRVVH